MTLQHTSQFTHWSIQSSRIGGLWLHMLTCPCQPLILWKMPTGKYYTDQTGHFQCTSSSGHNYILVAYHYGSNAILVKPLWLELQIRQHPWWIQTNSWKTSMSCCSMFFCYAWQWVLSCHTTIFPWRSDSVPEDASQHALMQCHQTCHLDLQESLYSWTMHREWIIPFILVG